MNDPLVAQYYRCFNDRRLDEAATFFAGDAVVEWVHGEHRRGGAGYRQVTEAWLAAFPDATFQVERVERRGVTIFETDLVATGTHRGLFDFGTYRFQPSGAEARLHVRELLDIRDGKIAVSILTVDLTDLIDQLTTINYGDLARQLDRIMALREELGRARDEQHRRDVGVRLGLALDAARRAIRPYFYERSSI